MDRLLTEIVMEDTHDIDEDISYFWIIIVLSLVLSAFYVIFAIVFWNGICVSLNLSCTSCLKWTLIPDCFKFCKRQLILPVSSNSNVSQNTISPKTVNVQDVPTDTKNPKLKKGVSRKEYFK